MALALALAGCAHRRGNRRLVPQDNELASEINARWWKPPHLIREQQFAPEAQNGILYSPFGVHYRQQSGLSIGCQRAEQQRPEVIDDTCLSLPNRLHRVQRGQRCGAGGRDGSGAMLYVQAGHETTGGAVLQAFLSSAVKQYQGVWLWFAEVGEAPSTL